MAQTIMAAIAANLVVAVVAGGLGDLCFDVCQDTEYRDLACRQACPVSSANQPNLLTTCEEQCSQIGAPCRTFCVDNFPSCKQECDQISTPDIYTCLVTCLKQRFSQTSTAN
ncbi:hypothetical protein BsWGS_28219 [Bradybaena similaris]